MRQMFNVFFDDNKLIHPQGPNGTLYTAEYQTIASPDDKLTDDDLLLAYNAGSKEVLQDSYSHDCADGYYVLGKRLGKPLPFQFGHHMYNPPNAIFYAWAQGGLLGWLMLPLLPISSIAMILSCLITSHKTISGMQVLTTDGILLAWVKFNNFNLPITKKICDFIIKKKYGGYQLIFNTFFGRFHPISIIAKERGL